MELKSMKGWKIQPYCTKWKNYKENNVTTSLLCIEFFKLSGIFLSIGMVLYIHVYVFTCMRICVCVHVYHTNTQLGTPDKANGREASCKNSLRLCRVAIGSLASSWVKREWGYGLRVLSPDSPSIFLRLIFLSKILVFYI